MMARRVHHINFIVRDLEAAIERYEEILDMPVTLRDRLEDRGVETARFRVGDIWIVLVQPTGSEGEPARYLRQNGEGFFLMSLEVESLSDEASRLGADIFEGDERPGVDDWRVRDLDAGQTFGAQLQLVTTGHRQMPDA
jgi:methylmalonyl-CoA/ethylmalonyl-CoA epimerase